MGKPYVYVRVMQRKYTSFLLCMFESKKKKKKDEVIKQYPGLFLYSTFAHIDVVVSSHSARTIGSRFWSGKFFDDDGAHRPTYGLFTKLMGFIWLVLYVRAFAYLCYYMCTHIPNIILYKK